LVADPQSLQANAWTIPNKPSPLLQAFNLSYLYCLHIIK